MNHSRPAPHRRGLVTAVAAVALAIAGVVVWMELPGNREAGPSARVAPDVPRHRHAKPATPASARGSNPAALPADQEMFVHRHRARGATVGTAKVLDGDLIEVEGKRFRLADIRAIPGYRHEGPSLHRWPRGTTPAQALQLAIGNAPVACYETGTNLNRERLGRCVHGVIDLGGWMIEYGMALPTSDRSDYRVLQNRARNEGRGWWYGQREDWKPLGQPNRSVTRNLAGERDGLGYCTVR